MILQIAQELLRNLLPIQNQSDENNRSRYRDHNRSIQDQYDKLPEDQRDLARVRTDKHGKMGIVYTTREEQQTRLRELKQLQEEARIPKELIDSINAAEADKPKPTDKEVKDIIKNTPADVWVRLRQESMRREHENFYGGRRNTDNDSGPIKSMFVNKDEPKGGATVGDISNPKAGISLTATWEISQRYPGHLSTNPDIFATPSSQAQFRLDNFSAPKGWN